MTRCFPLPTSAFKVLLLLIWTAGAAPLYAQEADGEPSAGLTAGLDAGPMPGSMPSRASRSTPQPCNR